MEEFSIRKYIIGAVFVLIGFIYIIRLFALQVTDSSYKHSAQNNSQRTVIQYPARGLVYDRNEELLVYNQAAYDLMIIPRQAKGLDTIALCKTLSMTKEGLVDLFKKMKTRRGYSYYKPNVLVKQITSEQYAVLMEKLHKFEGVYVQERTLRRYPRNIAAHVLGYVGEVNGAITESDPYYKSGDYIGISGIEKSFEKELRGKKGVKKLLVDVHNSIQGKYMEGKHDSAAVTGKRLITSLDSDLQEYGELLMRNKCGSIVAIEPSTGEILAMITSPSYDPNLMVGDPRSENYAKLQADSLIPLFNRALSSRYSPGSIFKVAQALIGLQMGVINENTGSPCGGAPVACHHHPDAQRVAKAIQFSCNPYFYKVFRKIIQQNKDKNACTDSRIGLKEWREHMTSFGLGNALKIDIPGSRAGLIPSIEFYDKWYPQKNWSFSTIYSLSIGQGEIETNPLQIANLAAAIANKGYYYTPHFVKKIEGKESIDPEYTTKHLTTIDPKYFEPIHEGMYMVVNEAGGTAVRGAKLDSIIICGKTGTVQNPQGEDHSGFFAFAPMENPKIAIAVYVENAGFGGTWAAPIASLMIEKYLTGKISDEKKEKRMLDYKQY